MKRTLGFFFFLLLFSQCDKVSNIPPTIISGAGIYANHGLNPGGSGTPSNQVVNRGVSKADKIKRKKRKKKHVSTGNHDIASPGIPARTSDSLFIARLKYLRTNGIEPDLNEHVSRDFLFSPIENLQSASLIRLSRESFFKVNFDNDIMDYTDRFYTNGIKLEILTPGLQMNPLSRLSPPYWSSGTNYYGISLVQNMYTPSTTKTGGILFGDRPYASYLYIGSFKITNDPTHTFRQTSELDAGIIGPNSYGEWVQRSFHNSVPTNNEPLGWEYQVQNDLVLNYSIAFEKGILNSKRLEILLASTANAGTLYTNCSGGGQLRAGWFNPYFANLGVSKSKVLREMALRKFQFFFFIKGSGKLVGYDATLQGGLFNKSSSYTLPASSISRLVFQASGGISFSLNGVRLDLEQFMLSPEFQDGWWHKWVHISLSFAL
ncbi:MAG: lipid A deacylase LpxR family protein [bacterium]